VTRVGLAICLLAIGMLPASAHAQARYTLAGGCYALKANDRFVVKTADGGYRAAAAAASGAEPFRLQATALGRYLLYGRAGDFVSLGQRTGLPVGAGATERVQSAPSASEWADWRVEDGFGISLPAAGRSLGTDGSGNLVLGEAGTFSFERADGCATYPEAETNATGEPSRGATPYGEVSGLLDAHMHMMAFEFLGGRIHCGRPWHPYGAPHALVDCPDHEPNGAGAVAENTLSYGNPIGFHDTRGWPTFKDWPHHASLTHEQSYYKWLERSWRGGLRIFVNLLVDNAVLCELYPLKRNSCDEMDGVRLQAARVRELQDYIDAQHGGPGKGWFRIVRDPFEARRVANEGKLAVVLGIEVSKLLDCGLDNERAECTAEQIDERIEEVHDLGVRDMELVNKFDNALAGVAGDTGTTGLVVNNGNRIETGKYWQMEHCDGHDHVHDRPQVTAPGVDRDQLAGNVLQAFGSSGAAPVYAAPPHCNRRGLSELGTHVIRRMIERKMVIDPDHLSVRARQDVLSLVERARYSGIVSSHSWSTPDSIPRIYRLGGVVTPYAGSSTDFVRQWRETLAVRDPRFYQGIGWGADMNGFGAQGGPRRGANPVTYPFKSFDGEVTLDRQRSGERVFDINVDGVAHYGLYPDWVEDLRKLAGEEIVKDLGRGAEAYLQMWERAEGIPAGCGPARARLTRRGLAGAWLGDTSGMLLRRAGQPRQRPGRAWTWCVNRRGRMTSVLTPGGRVALVASTAPGHRALGVRTGMRASRLSRRVRRFGRGVLVRRAREGKRFVYGVRRGRVAYVGVASPAAAPSPGALQGYLKLAGLR
jgi:hypothetical protein